MISVTASVAGVAAMQHGHSQCSRPRSLSRSGPSQFRGRALVRGASASFAASRRASRDASTARPPSDIQLRLASPESAPGSVLARTAGNFAAKCPPNNMLATGFISGLITDALDDFQFSEGVQDIDSSEDEMQDADSSEEEVEVDVRDAHVVLDAGEPTIDEIDEELEDSWAAASFFTEEAVRCAIPFSPAKSEDSTTSMAVNYEGIDDEDDDDFCMHMDGEDLDDDFEMEAATYLHMAFRLARVAVSAGMEEVEVAAALENEEALPAECEQVIERVQSSAFSPVLHRHDDDACSIHSADSDEEPATEELPKVRGIPGMKMLTSGPSAKEEAEALRKRAHHVFRGTSSDGRLFSAFRQVRSMHNQIKMLPQPSGLPALMGPTRELQELQAEAPMVLEPVEMTGLVTPAEVTQKHLPTKQRKAKVSQAPTDSASRAKSRPSTSAPKASEAIAPATIVRPVSSPADDAVSQAKPAEPTIRSLHTSRSRRRMVIGGVVRNQISSFQDGCETQQTCTAPSRHSSSGLRRHRSKQAGVTASFRMDSPAGNEQDDTRDSSLTRAYEALSAEVHCLDDADEADFYGLGSRHVVRAPSAGSLSNSHTSRRIAAFASAADLSATLRGAPLSAMGLDLGYDAKSEVSFTATRKPMSSSQSRHCSLGAVRVSKSHELNGRLPPLSTSKSTGLLPSLVAKAGHSKHRSQDHLAWSVGGLSSSKDKWASMSLVSIF